MVGLWVRCLGRGLVVVVVFGCDRCLKGLWVVARSSVWVIGRGWVRCLGHGWVVAEVGCWSSEIASVWVQRG